MHTLVLFASMISTWLVTVEECQRKIKRVRNVALVISIPVCFFVLDPFVEPGVFACHYKDTRVVMMDDCCSRRGVWTVVQPPFPLYKQPSFPLAPT